MIKVPADSLITARAVQPNRRCGHLATVDMIRSSQSYRLLYKSNSQREIYHKLTD